MVVGSCSLLLSECRVKITQFLIPGVGDNLDALVLRDVALEAFQMVNKLLGVSSTVEWALEFL